MLFGIVYPVVGIAFAAPANSSVSGEIRVAWRLAAWLTCAAVFAAHLGYEHFRLRNPPGRAALHVSAAVAFGAFALAMWINFQPHRVVSRRPRALLALVVFPVVTAVPAFLVALGTAAVLARRGRNV
jgi:hypothetical protein